ncbi:gamma-glutamyl-gamma-aminobutyrate hydrolase family protein [Thalassotalea sp. 1_MG-2023]|uniref:gamma-glutamyl-gamma-aminobutyrate hydrolase family protein n=1 Tax=Thalassotalea sp. 1_MG-2023 TaxID=3062680 RepID=UPI0026E338C5|nr:gamma-glutamyl-gamma-aminobutyrate hydrolase family protein [Thalassotalea sp. 1_MG-2023]MDO6428560.1 gamma-glutamyl-gamma-aminobutyrate hydrolase family protein [Thalassotalea sp. 1_MG-2023]
MNNKKPKIAVTGPNSGGLMAWLFTALNVKLAGGTPVRVTPNSFDGDLAFDGYIIGGGSDIHPKNRELENVPHYPRTLTTQIKEAMLYPMEFIASFGGVKYDKQRDEMEKQFIKNALQNDIPILGICRGHQLLNAHCGGTMYASTLDVLKEKVRARSVFPRKEVFVTRKNSLIRDIAGKSPVSVNAIHSQAIAKPGNNLQVTGIEKSGIAQVLETKDNSPVLGVQWHPEYLPYLQTHRAIFAWLVNEASS